MGTQPLALITGASRRAGIGAAIARHLARSGWDIAVTFGRPYDESMPWGCDPTGVGWLQEELTQCQVAGKVVEADLSLVETPVRIFNDVEEAIGPVAPLVVSHCHGSSSHILDTTIESFDMHFAVNVRASWLLIREFGRRFRSPAGRGRIVALTSDHVVGNLPYGASKGALDRIVLAAAEEFRDLGITANVINPGPTDTGWMSDQQIAEFASQTPAGRVGLPDDCAKLVQFLCFEAGGWVNGQLLHSNGGFK
jgi:3-oxoacyl-[acyl-carrier protein] reductase